jgi:hypothetical protein
MGYDKGFETGKGFAAGMKAGMEGENKKKKPDDKDIEK